jgi:uncharacterized protein with PIN domain
LPDDLLFIPFRSTLCAVKTARFHVDQALTDLLPRNRRAAEFDYDFTGPQSAKHLIESLGVPHTEIGAVLANGRSVGLNYLVEDGDDVGFRGAAPPADQLEEPRFIIDGHLGRLNSGLRMLGLDCLYGKEHGDDDLASASIEQGRILLTRDRRLLMRKAIVRGYLVRRLEPAQQLREVMHRFGLAKWIRPFQRCIRCNHLLEPIQKEAVLERLEPLTRRYFEEFRICPSCSQIYWKGSHFAKMQQRIAELR